MTSRSNRARVVLTCLLLALATLAVYWQVRSFDFTHYDDEHYITQNPNVRAGLTAEGLRWALTTTYFSYWHPLTWISHMADCHFFGLKPGLHHLTSVCLHTLTGVLLFLALYRMTGALARSGVVAALFLLHPLHVESVAWLAERKDVLSALFWILTMWAYAWYAQQPKVGRYLWTLLLFIFGLMSKPMLVTLPFVLLLLDYWPLGRLPIFLSASNSVKEPSLSGTEASNLQSRPTPLRRLLLEKVPFLALALISSAITFLGVRKAGHMFGADTVSWAFRIANVPVSYVRYIGKMICPEDLIFLYPMPLRWEVWQVAGACLFLACISLVVLAFAQSRPYLLFGWLWYLGTLVPTIGLIPVGWQSIADRYTYIPLLGLFIMVVWAVGDLARRWPYRKLALGTAAVLVLGGEMVGTWRQARHWSNSLTLFGHAVNVDTNNAVAHYNLGLALLHNGQVTEPIAHFRAALRIDAKKADAHSGLGYALSLLDRWEEARDHFAEALRLKADTPKTHYNLGRAEVVLGYPQRAISNFTAALRLQPDYAEAETQLALLLASQHRTEEAILHYQRALALKPDSLDALNNLAWLLATDSAAEVRNGREAVRLAKRACELTSSNSAPALLTLAAAYAETGQFTQAIQAIIQVKSLAGAAGQNELLETCNKMLETFQAGQPHRVPSL